MIKFPGFFSVLNFVKFKVHLSAKDFGALVFLANTVTGPIKTSISWLPLLFLFHVRKTIVVTTIRRQTWVAIYGPPCTETRRSTYFETEEVI